MLVCGVCNHVALDKALALTRPQCPCLKMQTFDQPICRGLSSQLQAEPNATMTFVTQKSCEGLGCPEEALHDVGPLLRMVTREHLRPFPELSLHMREKWVHTLQQVQEECLPHARHRTGHGRVKDGREQSLPVRGSGTPGKCCKKRTVSQCGCIQNRRIQYQGLTGRE